jgi:hypothetical protein
VRKSHTQLLTIVLDILCELTGMEQVVPNMPIMEAGIDSLSALEFVDCLNQLPGVKVGHTIVFEHATAQALAAHLAQLSGLCTDVEHPVL